MASRNDVGSAIRLACAVACVAMQLSGGAEAIGQEPTADVQVPVLSSPRRLESLPGGGTISGEPIATESIVVQPGIAQCRCAECVAGGYQDGPVFGEQFLLGCAEWMHGIRLRWDRLCRRLTHQTYYPRCAPYCDPCYGYRTTCWGRLPECRVCPPPGCVVLTEPRDGGEFFPPVLPATPDGAPAVMPPAPMPSAPLPTNGGASVVPSPGSAAP